MTPVRNAPDLSPMSMIIMPISILCHGLTSLYFLSFLLSISSQTPMPHLFYGIIIFFIFSVRVATPGACAFPTQGTFGNEPCSRLCVLQDFSVTVSSTVFSSGRVLFSTSPASALFSSLLVLLSILSWSSLICLISRLC
jgi:hypothetical protein